MTTVLSPVVIVGAGSDIGAALAHAYAARGHAIVLAARDPAALETMAVDLRIRYNTNVKTVACDVTEASPHAFLDRLEQVPGCLIMVAGLMGEQSSSAVDPQAAERVMATNYNGPARLLLAAAGKMEARGSGCIIGVSSVAGDRGRASNFIYGSAKAGFTAFLSGLRNHLARKGVHVITVKPGFVATKMTAAMNLPPALTARSSEVAEAILKAQNAGRDVIYVRWIWLGIMLVIRAIPERIFKRLSL